MNIRLFIRLIYLISIYYVFLNNYDTIKSLRKEVIKMHNNFELNETTGIGLIKDDNDNNILIKTDANEEQLTAILEKENEIESEVKYINNLKYEIIWKKLVNLFKISMYGLGTICFILVLINSLQYHLYALSIVLLAAISMFEIVTNLKTKSFKYNNNQIELLSKEMSKSKTKLNVLVNELERLKSKVQIEEMNTNDIVTSLINYPIRSEEENTNSYYNAQSGTVKFKSLRKEFEK